MINKDRVAVISGNGDPFAQLTRELEKSRSDEIEKLLSEGRQVVLDLEPSDTPPTDHTYNLQMNRLRQVRPIAERLGVKLLYDDFRCEECNCKDIRREFDGRYWAWKCVNCGSRKSGIMEVKQLKDLLLSKPKPMPGPSQEWSTGIEVFSVEDINNSMDNVGTVSSDEHSTARLKATLVRLLEIGTIRPYVVPGAAWQGQLDELRENFPNFLAAVDEVLEPSFAISAAGGRCRPAPLLLVGPPGVGKSYFSSLIAGVLKTPMFKLDMSSATAGSSLDGLSTHWSNAAPGEVFKTLAFGRGGVMATAGPVGFLDEIDKVGPGLRYDPLGPLYNLLEVESARNFEDQSLPGIRIDASHVRWIACSNTLETIPQPILSRMHIVHVAAPTAAETQHMFTKIFADVVNNTGLCDFGNQISRAVISNAVEKFSAREFKTRSVMAIGRALARNRHFVEAEDFCTAPAPKARKMGF